MADKKDGLDRIQQLLSITVSVANLWVLLGSLGFFSAIILKSDYLLDFLKRFYQAPLWQLILIRLSSWMLTQIIAAVIDGRQNKNVDIIERILVFIVWLPMVALSYLSLAFFWIRVVGWFLSVIFGLF